MTQAKWAVWPQVLPFSHQKGTPASTATAQNQSPPTSPHLSSSLHLRPPEPWPQELGPECQQQGPTPSRGDSSQIYSPMTGSDRRGPVRMQAPRGPFLWSLSVWSWLPGGGSHPHATPCTALLLQAPPLASMLWGPARCETLRALSLTALPKSPHVPGASRPPLLTVQAQSMPSRFKPFPLRKPRGRLPPPPPSHPVECLSGQQQLQR